MCRGGPLAVYSVTAAGMACGVQRCIRCIHELTTGVQRVLQPEEKMGTLHTGQYTGPSAQVSVIYSYAILQVADYFDFMICI